MAALQLPSDREKVRPLTSCVTSVVVPGNINSKNKTCTCQELETGCSHFSPVDLFSDKKQT